MLCETAVTSPSAGQNSGELEDIERVMILILGVFVCQSNETNSISEKSAKTGNFGKILH